MSSGVEHWTTWEDLGASLECIECPLKDDKFVNLPLYQEIPPDRPGGSSVPVVYIFGLNVPDRFANKTLASVGLRRRFNLNAVAVEMVQGKKKRLNLAICAHNSVMPPPGLGVTLWVGVQGGIDSLKQICEFLGELPQTLRARWVPLRPFSVGRIPQWVGRNLIENRIRAEHGVNVLGVCFAAGRGERVQMFPEPGRKLVATDLLLVLRPDEERLEGIAQRAGAPAEASVMSSVATAPEVAAAAAAASRALLPPGPPPSGSGPNRRQRGLTTSQVEHAERLLRPDPAPNSELMTKARYVKENAQAQSHNRQLQAEVDMLQWQLAQREGEAMGAAATAAAAAQVVNPWFGLLPTGLPGGMLGMNPFAPLPWGFPGPTPGMPLGWFPQASVPPESRSPPTSPTAVRADRRSFRGGAQSATLKVSGGPRSAAPGRSDSGAAGAAPSASSAAGRKNPGAERVASGAVAAVAAALGGVQALGLDGKSPLSALMTSVERQLADGQRKPPGEKQKAIDVLAVKQAVVRGALAHAFEDNRGAAIRAESLERVFDLSKDETGCLLIKLLLGNTQEAVSWEELRSSEPADMTVDQIFPGETYYTPVVGADSVSMQVVGLEIPSRLDGCSVYELNLREAFRFSAVALEIGGALDVRVQKLQAGAWLWVGFEFDTVQAEAMESIREFLGDLPVTLPVRQLALASFAVDERPEWLGKNLVQNRIRNDYEVSVLGIYPAMTKSLIDIVWFPKPDQMLGEGDRLLVLHRDLRRLKEGPGAAAASLDKNDFGERFVAAMCLADRVEARPGSNRVVELAKDRHGCHVVQEALRCLPAGLKTALVGQLIDRPDVLLQEVVKSQHGIHVVRECLVQAYTRSFSPAAECDRVAETFLSMVKEEAGVHSSQSGPLPPQFLGASGSLLDKKKFSYRLVLWLIEYFSEQASGHIEDLMAAFARNTRQLIDDHNGSIVLSSVLEFAEVHREEVFHVILESIDVAPIPKHWYPSFLIDKLIINRHILDSLRDGNNRLLAALLRNDNLARIYSHRSGGYTARRVYEDLANDEERNMLAVACPGLAQTPPDDPQRKRPDKKTDFNFNDSLLRAVSCSRHA